MSRQIKIRAADTLLGRGVRVASIYPSDYFNNEDLPTSVDFVIYQPTLGGLIEISKLIEQMELDANALQKINLTDSYALVSNTARLAIEALYLASRLNHPLITREQWLELLTNSLYPYEFEAAWSLLVLHSGVADFISTTKSLLTMSILNPLT